MLKALIATFVAAAIVLLAPAALALPKGTEVQTYVSSADNPIDMAWVEGTKKVFYTEKNSGMVRVLDGRRLLSRPCVDLDVDPTGESGALGIALHPNFKRNHFLYVYYTNASPVENRVTRFKVRNDRCRSPKSILRGIPSGGYHNGGQLEFVGNKLFITVGEAHDASHAQNRSSRLGKILRFNADGSIPDGNPFSQPGSKNPVWSYGHRNGFGLARRPGTKMLYETENGPECDDEINLIRKGQNYGWGSNYQCGTDGEGSNPVGPLVRYSQTIAPTDAWWYEGRMKSLSGSLYFGDYNNGQLHRLFFNAKGTDVRRERVIYRTSGITDVSKGPGGWLYVLTSDSIVRIVPQR
jgi:glucose/arabinose dehydrogenase